MGKKHGLSFSWKRATGITGAKIKFAKSTGIPTTKQGMQRKIGSGCLPIFLFGLLGILGIITLIKLV